MERRVCLPSIGYIAVYDWDFGFGVRIPVHNPGYNIRLINLEKASNICGFGWWFVTFERGQLAFNEFSVPMFGRAIREHPTGRGIEGNVCSSCEFRI